MDTPNETVVNETMMDVLTNLFHDMVSEYGPELLMGLAILILGWFFAKLFSTVLKRVLNKANIDKTLTAFFGNLAYITMLVLVVIAALDKFGFPAMSFAAVVGAAGLAIGLALKGSLSNLASGVMLIAMRPFNVGDQIEVAGVKGIVTHIQVFATTIESEDQKIIIIPNANITSGIITNHKK